MKILCHPFGTLSDGRKAVLYTLENNNGACIKLSNYGAAVVSIMVPNKDNALVDIVLGCDSAADYEVQTACLGSVPGRHANRIEKGVFTLNKKSYQLSCNAGGNHLHGGKVGFDKKLWSHSVVGNRVIFSYFSPDEEEGYPGNLIISVAYTWEETDNGENRLSIDYHALSDQDTVVNFTNHSYFNLSGHNSGNVLDQYLQINADSFTENNSQSVPNGNILSLDGSPLDFRVSKPIGQDIEADDANIKIGNGYDHNYLLNNPDGNLVECAKAYSPKTGISLSCQTTQPGVQLYTANYIQETNVRGKSSAMYPQRSGFCLETQHYPNSMAHPSFPSVVLHAGQLFNSSTIFQFALNS